MTESQRIILNWKAELRKMGWPDDATRRIIADLCEAGYRQCVEDIQAKSAQKEALIAAATGTVQ